MNIAIKIARLAVLALLPLVAAGCSTTMRPASVASTHRIAETSSPVVSVVGGPFSAAKACIAKIPGANTLNIGVGDIADQTGKVNLTDSGTGNFLSQGMSQYFYSSLYDLGVSVTDLTAEQKGDVTFIVSAGVHGKMRTPSYMVRGGVTALDFSETSNVAEVSVFGFGPKARAYNAVGGMDVRLVTMPGGESPSNIMVGKSQPVKQFVAVESEAGFGTFVGDGAGITFASFRLGGSAREPMQYTMRFMADYAASDLVLDLMEYLNRAGHPTGSAAAISQCRSLLEEPASKKVLLASAN